MLEGFARTNAPAQPAPSPGNAPSAYQPPGDGDYVTGADVRGYAEQMARQTRADAERTFAMIAESNIATVRQRHPDWFAKFGPQITATLAQITDKSQLTLDNVEKLVKFTLVDHLPDLVREEAARVAGQLEPTLRSTGAGGPPIAHQNADYTLQSEKLPPDWKERAAKVGMTEAALDEFCRAQDMTRETWFKLFGNSVITESPPR